MKRFISLCFFTLLCSCLYLNAFVGTKDQVLATIDGKNIYLSEFEHFYNCILDYKDCSIDEYFQYFLRYKMKAFDAKRLGLDRNSGYKQKNDFLKSCFSTPRVGKVNGHSTLFQMLTYRLRQDEDTSEALMFMQNFYSGLKSGVTLKEAYCSVGPNLKLQFNEFTDTIYLLDEIKENISKVPFGTYSKPFISPEGIHIVGKLSIEKTFNDISDCLEDVLLASEWDKSVSSVYLKCSDEDLENYFKKNRKKYLWDLPHYKGAVIHCKDKKIAKKIKKKLRKVPVSMWNNKLEELKNEDSRYDSVIKTGLFCIGENEYIDKLVFKCGDYSSVDDYPYTFVLGKCLDYMPENYDDVRDILVRDYIQYREEQYFDDLEHNLRVEKYIDVLKTVNSSGSN